MKKIYILVILFFATTLILIGSSFANNKIKKIPEKLTPFTVVLDWTPNTNHTGMYVALAKGWYKNEGLDVRILPYSSSSSPDVLVTSGKADVGVSAAEGVIADAATGNPVVSIAAIMQHNTSGFMALADNGVKTPKDLDNKIYGGSGSPIETAILKKIITKDGGEGTVKSVNLDVAAMQALTSKKIDFFWVFEGWEVIQAKQQGFKVVYFPSLKYGIPDYYTPVLITSPTEIKQKPEILKKFMAATTKGYQYAAKNPKDAAKILISATPKGTFPDTKFIEASQEFVSAHYVDEGRQWGLQDKKSWHDYPQFMLDAGAVVDSAGKPIKKLNFDSLYTNKFLQ